jgi:hypothetical protein
MDANCGFVGVIVVRHLGFHAENNRKFKASREVSERYLKTSVAWFQWYTVAIFCNGGALITSFM